MAHDSFDSWVGIRVLVAEADPLLALALAATLAARGAGVSVARSESAARRITGPDLDAAIVSCRADARWGVAVADALRKRRRVCLSLVLVNDPAEVPALVADGHTELVIMPTDGMKVARALRRVVDATRRIRRQPSRILTAGYGCATPRLHPAAAPHRRAVHPHSPALAHDLDRAIETVGTQRALSARERSVLRLIAMGYGYPEIGNTLAISPRTVKMHAASLRSKTGTESRSALLKVLFGA